MSEFDFEAEVEGLGYLVLVPSWCQSSGEFLPRMIEKLKAKKLETAGTSHGGLVKLWLIDEGAAAEEGSSTFDLKVLNGDRQGIQRLLLKYSVLETPCIILPEHNKVVTFRELCANDNVSVSGEALPLQYSSSFGDGGALAEGADNKEVFDRAMDAYNEFDFTRACNLFSLITACTPPLPVVGEGEGEGELDTTAASRYNSSLFNLAGLFHMMELPSLSLLPSVRLLKVSRSQF